MRQLHRIVLSALFVFGLLACSSFDAGANTRQSDDESISSKHSAVEVGAPVGDASVADAFVLPVDNGIGTSPSSPGWQDVSLGYLLDLPVYGVWVDDSDQRADVRSRVDKPDVVVFTTEHVTGIDALQIADGHCERLRGKAFVREAEDVGWRAKH